MSDEQCRDEQVEVENDVIEQDAGADDEYEEISSDEVDRVIEGIEKLMESVSSENIKVILEEASNNIYYLVYTDEDAEEDEITDAAA